MNGNKRKTEAGRPDSNCSGLDAVGRRNKWGRKTIVLRTPDESLGSRGMRGNDAWFGNPERYRYCAWLQYWRYAATTYAIGIATVTAIVTVRGN